MHQFQVGFAADTWRLTAGAPVEKLLRRIAAEGIVLGSTGAEALVAGAWTTATTAQREDGGYRISGRKYFCSQAPGMDLVPALKESGRRVLARAKKTADAAGVRFHFTKVDL